MRYARAMGYRTYYVDGQLRSFWIGDPASRDVLDVDRWIPRDDRIEPPCFGGGQNAFGLRDQSCEVEPGDVSE